MFWCGKYIHWSCASSTFYLIWSKIDRLTAGHKYPSTLVIMWCVQLVIRTCALVYTIIGTVNSGANVCFMSECYSTVQSVSLPKRGICAPMVTPWKCVCACLRAHLNCLLKQWIWTCEIYGRFASSEGFFGRCKI